MSFLSEDGSGQAILAQTSGQTLVGSPQFGDTFRGTSEAFNGDLIQLYAGNDVIDVTDLAFGHTTLSYSGTETAGIISLSDGVHSTGIGLSGDFNQSGFHVASDLHGGTNITYG